MRVWDALRKVPAGTTVCYTFLAEQIGAPNAVQAVAQAGAANPLAVCNSPSPGDPRPRGFGGISLGH